VGEAHRARDTLTGERAGRQAGALRAALRARGLDDETRGLVDRAVTLAMRPRLLSLTDDHHPSYLHPGRAVLILLHDVDNLPGPTLPVTAVHESLDHDLRLGTDEITRTLGREIGAMVESLPLPGAEDLEERLVLLGREGALAVLAERLDHLRHLHMRVDTESQWTEVHAEVERAWLPFAQRTDQRLAQRFAHWTRTFRRRLP